MSLSGGSRSDECGSRSDCKTAHPQPVYNFRNNQIVKQQMHTKIQDIAKETSWLW